MSLKSPKIKIIGRKTKTILMQKLVHFEHKENKNRSAAILMLASSLLFLLFGFMLRLD